MCVTHHDKGQESLGYAGWRGCRLLRRILTDQKINYFAGVHATSEKNAKPTCCQNSWAQTNARVIRAPWMIEKTRSPRELPLQGSLSWGLAQPWRLRGPPRDGSSPDWCCCREYEEIVEPRLDCRAGRQAWAWSGKLRHSPQLSRS